MPIIKAEIGEFNRTLKFKYSVFQDFRLVGMPSANDFTFPDHFAYIFNFDCWKLLVMDTDDNGSFA